jgi:LmbE family N-acetylglucosaminyl deacetylase
VRVLHVTDGAPEDPGLRSPRAPGSRSGYAALRADEARAALALVGVPARHLHALGLKDQEASHELVALVESLTRLFAALGPEAVVVHPYEGGHPDHDATAFAVHAAVRQLQARGRAAPFLVEMTSYHRWEGALRTGEFLPGGGRAFLRRLSEDGRATKARMLACFASQSEVLAPFRVEQERFRRPPAYDFRRPPHAGLLHYESLGWRMSAARWCRLASEALDVLGPPPCASALPDSEGGGAAC